MKLISNLSKNRFFKKITAFLKKCLFHFICIMTIFVAHVFSTNVQYWLSLYFPDPNPSVTGTQLNLTTFSMCVQGTAPSTCIDNLIINKSSEWTLYNDLLNKGVVIRKNIKIRIGSNRPYMESIFVLVQKNPDRTPSDSLDLWLDISKNEPIVHTYKYGLQQWTIPGRDSFGEEHYLIKDSHSEFLIKCPMGGVPSKNTCTGILKLNVDDMKGFIIVKSYFKMTYLPDWVKIKQETLTLINEILTERRQ